MHSDNQTWCFVLRWRRVGAWVGIEYMAQAIGAMPVTDEPIRLGFILGTRRYESNWPVFEIGSTLNVAVERLLEGESGLASFDCEIVDTEQIGR